MTEIELRNFISRIDKTPGQGPNGSCWGWIGAKRNDYGVFRYRTIQYQATTLIWLINTGEWPTLDICHTCDYPPCVRIAHLFEGTHDDNMYDRDFKGRCTKGSKHYKTHLTEENAEEMRRMYATGDYYQRELGELFGITSQTVSRLINFVTWKHV